MHAFELLALAAAGFYLLFLATWVMYLAVMNLAEHRDRLHPFAKFNAYLLLFLVGYPLDVLFNVVGSFVLFQRPPKHWLFTGTLKHWIASDDDRRSRHAAWICEHLLNQFDPKGKHC
jgi:hypothetical protein